MRPLPPTPRGVKSIRAILFDPFQQTLFELDGFPAESLPHMYWILDCDCVEAVRLGDDTDHILWVDESGAIRSPFIYPQFRFKRYGRGEYALSGYGLITGRNGPECADCRLDAEKLRHEVSFEPWQNRIDPDLVMEQVFRNYNNIFPSVAYGQNFDQNSP